MSAASSSGDRQGLRALIGQARRRVRLDGAWAAGAAVAVVVPTVLLVAWLLGDAPSWGAPSPAPLLLELGALVAAAAAGGWLIRRWVVGFDENHAAAAAEQTLGLPEGSVRGVLELGRDVPAGTSPALFRHAEDRLAGHVAGTGPAKLSGVAGEVARRRRRRATLALAGAMVIVLVLGFSTPGRTKAAWSPLAHPVSYLKPPPMPALEVRPGDARVARGTALDVAIRAPQRRWVQIHWRTPGEVARARELDVNGDAARTRLGAIDAPTTYWVSAPDGAVSDTFRITPIDPLMLSDLVVDVLYPGYLSRASEQYTGDVPALQIPAGTQLRIRGRGTRALSAAQLVERSSGRRVLLHADADRFSALWTPAATGTYDWALADRAGAGLESAPPPLDLTVLPDSAPHVELVVPVEDTTLPADLREPIAANAWDDHGLRTATLVSWRSGESGGRDATVEQPLDLGGPTDRATLQAVLDATSRRLLPGDVLHFYIRVTDNSPARQSGVSRTISLRLPGLDELRLQAARQAAAMLSDALSLSKTASGLQDETRNLERETAAENARNASGSGGSPDAGGAKGLSYERSQQAKKVLDQQDQMVQQVEDLKARTSRLEKATTGAGLQDPELQQRLQELKDLYDKILTPEMRQQMEQLQQALAKQDPEAVQKALEELTKQQEEFRKQLDKSIEAMRRAAAEQQMNALAEQARELAMQEKALAQALKQQPDGASAQDRQQRQELAQRQKELAGKADSLSQAVEQMRQKLQQQGESQAAQQAAHAGKQADQAQQQMDQAAKGAEQQPNKAGQQAQQAADSLSAAAQTLDQARQQMSQGWNQQAQQAIQQATNEALSMAQRQASISKQLKKMEEEQPPEGQTLQQMMQQQQQSGGQQQDQPDPAQSGSQGVQQQAQANAQQQGGGKGGRSPQQGGGQAGGKQGQGQQGQNGKGGGKMAAGQSQPGGSGDLQSLKAEQQALQQSLQRLGENLARAGERSPVMNKDVGNALARAMMAMQQAMQAQEKPDQDASQRSDQTVDALNRLALALATGGNMSGGSSEGGEGNPQALQQLGDLARKQSQVNGQTSALVPLQVAPSAVSQQMQGLAQQEKAISQKLNGLANKGGNDQLLGKLDELSRQADQLARDMSGGQLTAELMRRQQELFHRLLDAGRTLEKDEVSPKRVAESPGSVGAIFGKPLDPALFQGGLRYTLPTTEQLQALPPAYRRLILNYFERLNRAAAPQPAATHARTAADARRDSTAGGE